MQKNSKKRFNKKIKNAKAVIRFFSGANTKQLDHYILPP